MKAKIKKVIFDVGWYSGEPVTLVGLTIYEKYFIYTVFFNLKILKFCISIIKDK